MSDLTIQTTGDTETEQTATDAEAHAAIRNPDRENGQPTSGPLSWMNSARITTDPKDDAVHCLVSVGDPRGAFCFTVRRLPDGRLIIHTPHPGEGWAHMETRQLHDGALVVLNQTSGPREDWPLYDASDDPPEYEEALDALTRAEMQEICEGQLGMAVYDDEPDSDLREAIAQGIDAGDVDADDLPQH